MLSRFWVLGLTSLLAACAGPPKPIDPQLTVSQLRQMIENPPACDTYIGLGGLREDPERCAYTAKRRHAALMQALYRRIDSDLSAAPNCLLNNKVVPDRVLREEDIDPESPYALATFIEVGYYVKFSDCAAEVCQWRRDVEPTASSTQAFCDQAARVTASSAPKELASVATQP